MIKYYDDDCIEKIINDLNPQSTVIDLGANVGKYTIPFSRRGSRVYAFEPDPVSLNVLYNDTINIPNVDVIPMAVGSEDKRIMLFRSYYFKNDPVNFSVSSSRYMSRLNMDLNNFIYVEQINFCKYFLKNIYKNEVIDVLKIDIEGCEVEIMNDLIDNEIVNHFKTILIETHEDVIPNIADDISKIKKIILEKEYSSNILFNERRQFPLPM